MPTFKVQVRALCVFSGIQLGQSSYRSGPHAKPRPAQLYLSNVTLSLEKKETKQTNDMFKK